MSIIYMLIFSNVDTECNKIKDINNISGKKLK